MGTGVFVQLPHFVKRHLVFYAPFFGLLTFAVLLRLRSMLV